MRVESNLSGVESRPLLLEVLVDLSIYIWRTFGTENTLLSGTDVRTRSYRVITGLGARSYRCMR